jgi:formate hydrogenlyase subunit 3/multisubunit Na+/H+ antiporter MnhD subunit
MITWSIVLKFMAATTAALGVSVVVRRGRANRVSPFASLISTFGLIIMAVAFLGVSGIETVYVLVGGAAVYAIGFFLERISRLDGYDEEVGLE